ncbi:prolyl oligopeptidase family protein, partial [Striga asiatica]
MFGDVRIDNYYWLRDDSRSDPLILAHLQQENAYNHHLMSGTKLLEDQIYSEIRGRLKEDDITAPLHRGTYYYYKRTLKGKKYVQHWRCLVPNASVYETMPTGPDAPQEQVHMRMVHN